MITKAWDRETAEQIIDSLTDLIEVAKVGFYFHATDRIAAALSAARANELEACLVAVEGVRPRVPGQVFRSSYLEALRDASAAIRARKEQP